MYLQHFALREFPFSITPDTSFFFSSSGSQEALNTLLVAARMGEGFIKITGEVGTGKTLLCRKLIMSLGGDFRVAYIPNPYLEPIALFMEVASELGVEVDLRSKPNQHQLLKMLTDKLLELAREGKRVVICLDEAQAMPIETLEALRLLTNLETEKRKLLQVIIFGQPELEAKLNHPSIRQLKQRITFHYHLTPLTGSELADALRAVAHDHETPVLCVAAARAVGAGDVASLLAVMTPVRYYSKRVYALTAPALAGGAGEADPAFLARVNDAFGFDVADAVIAEVGKRIRAKLRGGDVLGRFSGNKFGLILRNCTVDDTNIAAERFLAGIQAFLVVGTERRVLLISAIEKSTDVKIAIDARAGDGHVS